MSHVKPLGEANEEVDGCRVHHVGQSRGPGGNNDSLKALASYHGAAFACHIMPIVRKRNPTLTSKAFPVVGAGVPGWERPTASDLLRRPTANESSRPRSITSRR